jgi:hypothetical protein
MREYTAKSWIIAQICEEAGLFGDFARQFFHSSYKIDSRSDRTILDAVAGETTSFQECHMTATQVFAAIRDI